jgi:hypothetical protein
MIKLIILSLITLSSFDTYAHSGHVHGKWSALLVYSLWCLPVFIVMFIDYKMNRNKDWIDQKYNNENTK